MKVQFWYHFEAKALCSIQFYTLHLNKGPFPKYCHESTAGADASVHGGTEAYYDMKPAYLALLRIDLALDIVQKVGNDRNSRMNPRKCA